MASLRFEQFIIIAAVFIFFFILIQLMLVDYTKPLLTGKLTQLKGKIVELENLMNVHKEQNSVLRYKLSNLVDEYEAAVSAIESESKNLLVGEWHQPIAVLVFACNRPHAVKYHINQLLKYRPSSEMFPVIVSQDCEEPEIKNVVDSFGGNVGYIKHESSDNISITVDPKHPDYIIYYKIARHYKLGLSYIFDKLNYTSVIITEDDLDIAPDFFQYFSATRKLLEADPTLYCISAWNDNGKLNLIARNHPEMLHRTDFFPGLGWIMTKSLWEELGPIWPQGFWDDWIRDPLRRKGRSCIRPEISRTGITSDGRKGASNGLFYNDHLAKIHINTVPVDLTKFNLAYLLKENYDNAFLERVYSSELIPITSLKNFLIGKDKRLKEIRIEYETMDQFLYIASKLKIMHDFKAGVPRTAYIGVVSCFIDGIRIFAAPNRTVWKDYQPHWEAPEILSD